ncbi:MAG TPA: HAMP domain-containing sensor histidine kinase [Polyangia bacterium]|jgi:signal transduction histidine kinase|nr:HAMP domain-containing sensor histidine kinase [Polyangia bacterium]
MKVHELQHLAAAMAHEVRNPLNSMAIHVELLESRLRKEGAAPEALKSLGVLADEIERVDKILEQYLAFAGPTEAARVTLPARQLLDGVVARLADAAKARGVTLALEGGEGAWAVDAEALSEALVAVGENAIAASPAGSQVIICARTDEDRDQAEVTIADAAAPIEAAEVAKVFHMGSERSGGELGLTVAKQIVKGHGGSITVKSREGGNLFTIRLPLDFEGES